MGGAFLTDVQGLVHATAMSTVVGLVVCWGGALLDGLFDSATLRLSNLGRLKSPWDIPCEAPSPDAAASAPLADDSQTGEATPSPRLRYRGTGRALRQQNRS